MEADVDRVAGGAVAGEAVLGAFWADSKGRAGGLKREEVRAAAERALEVWLFGAAGRPEKRSCPSCAEGRLGLRSAVSAPSSAARAIPSAATPVRSGATRRTRAPGPSPSARTPGPRSRSRFAPGATRSAARTPKARALLALPPHGGNASGDGQGHPRRDRALRAVAQTRGHLPAPARGRGRAHRRPHQGESPSKTRARRIRRQVRLRCHTTADLDASHPPRTGARVGVGRRRATRREPTESVPEPAHRAATTGGPDDIPFSRAARAPCPPAFRPHRLQRWAPRDPSPHPRRPARCGCAPGHRFPRLRTTGEVRPGPRASCTRRRRLRAAPPRLRGARARGRARLPLRPHRGPGARPPSAGPPLPSREALRRGPALRAHPESLAYRQARGAPAQRRRRPQQGSAPAPVDPRPGHTERLPAPRRAHDPCRAGSGTKARASLHLQRVPVPGPDTRAASTPAGDTSSRNRWPTTRSISMPPTEKQPRF